MPHLPCATTQCTASPNQAEIENLKQKHDLDMETVDALIAHEI
jgi:hypothetical protein